MQNLHPLQLTHAQEDGNVQRGVCAHFCIRTSIHEDPFKPCDMLGVENNVQKQMEI